MGSSHLSIIAYSANFSLTETIIHGIISSINHTIINIVVSIEQSIPFQILSRVIPFQKFLILASIQFIKSNVNARVHILIIVDIMFITKFGIIGSPSVHSISPNMLSIIQIPRKIMKIISEITKKVRAFPSFREILRHSLRISENEIFLFVFVSFLVILSFLCK